MKVRILQLGDYVELGYDLISKVAENKYEITYSAQFKKDNAYKPKRLGERSDYKTEIVLPKILIFQNDLQYGQLFKFNGIKFKVLGIFLRPRNKSTGEERKIINYENVFVQRMLDKKGYYFLLEDSVNYQIFTIKAIYIKPCQK